MNTNYTDEFTAKYIAALEQTKTGDYANNSAEYHLLLSTFRNLMECINDTANVQDIVKTKQTFDACLDKVQKNVSKAWKVKFPKDEFPSQTSIHGINILILKILE